MRRSLRSAIELLEKGSEKYSEAFVPTVVYSKLGEAHLRVAKYKLPSTFNYARAFDCMLTSKELGNNAHQLLGLMGDAKYRLGALTNKKSDLLLAADAQVAREISPAVGRPAVLYPSRNANCASYAKNLAALRRTWRLPIGTPLPSLTVPCRPACVPPAGKPRAPR